MDLFGSTRISSLNKSRYVSVIVDDYSHFTWVVVLKNKNDAFDDFQVFVREFKIRSL